MNTPIFDFVNKYAASDPVRLHMPGHKGRALLGPESQDITEIAGADALYEAAGIIRESENNAARLFGAGYTLYSTEGSSQCIKTMVHLAASAKQGRERALFIAARNAHKSFIHALSLTDSDVLWLYPEEDCSICSCPVTAKAVERAILSAPRLPVAVYLTGPDYLGVLQDISAVAEVCHRHGVLLLVDNAHGAYLHFLPKPRHPMDLGADLCCDSAHKTLPVLTGGAYLHISKSAAARFEHAKDVMEIYGSTSPSYLTLCSLDLCCRYLEETLPKKLPALMDAVQGAKEALTGKGWNILQSEPLKITLCCGGHTDGRIIAAALRAQGIEPEFADRTHLVLMVSTETTREELARLVQSLGVNEDRSKVFFPKTPRPPRACSPREAVFSAHDYLQADQSEGRVCGLSTVGCPPAIPLVVPGEVLDGDVIAAMKFYGYETVCVMA